MLIVLGSLLLGGITGSLLRIEDRLEGFGGVLQPGWPSTSRRGGPAAPTGTASSRAS